MPLSIQLLAFLFYCLLTTSAINPLFQTDQWVSSIVNVSYQFVSGTAGWYSAQQIVGPPDVYPGSGDNFKAWKSTHGGMQFIAFSVPKYVYITNMTIYETNGAGSISSISALDQASGQWMKLWSGTPTGIKKTPVLFSPFQLSIANSRLANTFRLDLNTSAVPTYPEIDAIQVSGLAPGCSPYPVGDPSIGGAAGEMFCDPTPDQSLGWRNGDVCAFDCPAGNQPYYVESTCLVSGSWSVSTFPNCVSISTKAPTAGISVTQWAGSITTFSSQTSKHPATAVIGPADFYPSYGSSPLAWAPTSAISKLEYLEVFVDIPIMLQSVSVYETFNPGSVLNFYVKGDSKFNNSWVHVWTQYGAQKSEQAFASDILILFNLTNPLQMVSSQFRIEFNPTLAADIPQIDAIQFVGISPTIACPRPDGPAGGEALCTGFLVGDVCSYQCSTNWIASADSNISSLTIIVCGSDGTWNTSSLESAFPTYCAFTGCSPLPAPANGFIDCSGTGTLPGDACQYKCSYGYFLSDTALEYTTCQGYGEWSSIPPECTNEIDKPRVVGQWARRIVAYGGERSNSAQQVLGSPDVWPNATDSPLAWAPAPMDGDVNFIDWETLEFTQVLNITVFETWGAGGTFMLHLWDYTVKAWTLLWNGTAVSVSSPRVFTPFNFSEPHPIVTNRFRLVIKTSIPGWNEIDAIGVVGFAYPNCPLPANPPTNGGSIISCTRDGNQTFDVCTFTCPSGSILPANLSSSTCQLDGRWDNSNAACTSATSLFQGYLVLQQWVSEVVSYSSQTGNASYAAKQIVGVPDVYSVGLNASNPNAWLPLRSDPNPYIEFIVQYPVNLLSVSIYETFLPGAVSRILAKDHNSSSWYQIWAELNASSSTMPRIFTPINFTQASTGALNILSNRFRIEFKLSTFEIDAVTVTGLVPSIECPILAPPEQGVVSCSGSSTTDRCYFTCNVGYVPSGLTGITTNLAVCGYDGTWNITQEQASAYCIDENIRCPALTKPSHGTLICTGTGIVPGNVCNFYCDLGYIPSSSGRLECLRGNWSTAIPVCQESLLQVNSLPPTVISLTQYVHQVIGLSSQTIGHPATALVGAPDVFPLSGDSENAWLPSPPNRGFEYVEFSIQYQVYLFNVTIYESFGPGAITSFLIWDSTNLIWVPVWHGLAGKYGAPNRAFTPFDVSEMGLNTTAFSLFSNKFRLEFNTAISGLHEIDAIAVSGVLSTTACPVLKAPAFGMITCKGSPAGRMLGDECSLVCNPGYMIFTNISETVFVAEWSTTCGAGGKWDGTTPICINRRAFATTSGGFRVNSIQQAIADAYPGQVIEIPAGRWTGCMSSGIIVNQTIWVRGDWNGGTVIDCQGSGAGFNFIGVSDNMNLTGLGQLAIINTVSKLRGAAVSSTLANMTIESVVIQNSRVNSTEIAMGGAVYTVNSVVNISQCSFISNVAAHFGGAMYFDSGSVVQISDSLFLSNSAATFGGGAIYAFEAEVNIWRSVFQGNTAVWGGAIVAEAFNPNQSATVNLFRCNVEQNIDRAGYQFWVALDEHAASAQIVTRETYMNPCSWYERDQISGGLSSFVSVNETECCASGSSLHKAVPSKDTVTPYIGYDTTAQMWSSDLITVTLTMVCRDCPSGSFGGAEISPMFGLSAWTSCEVCLAGTASPIVASTNNTCEPCQQGWAAGRGSAQCTRCQPGQFSNSSASCDLCSSGYYSNVYESLWCLPCPNGYAAAPGSTECQLCIAGQRVADDYSECVPCSSGSYSTTDGSHSCTSCLPGSTSPAGSTSCTACLEGQAPNADRSSCIPCPSGTYANQSLSPTCTLCPLGTYNGFNGKTICQDCGDLIPLLQREYPGEQLWCHAGSRSPLPRMSLMMPTMSEVAYAQKLTGTSDLESSVASTDQIRDIQVGILAIGAVLFAAFLALVCLGNVCCQARLLKRLQSVDLLYSTENQSPIAVSVKRKTPCGGFISIIAILSILLICSSMIYRQIYDNSLEVVSELPGPATETLLPELTVMATAYGLGLNGTCVDGASSINTTTGQMPCSSSVTANSVYLYSGVSGFQELPSLSCQQDAMYSSCTVFWRCNKCQLIQENPKVTISWNDPAAFALGISYVVVAHGSENSLENEEVNNWASGIIAPVERDAVLQGLPASQVTVTLYQTMMIDQTHVTNILDRDSNTGNSIRAPSPNSLQLMSRPNGNYNYGYLVHPSDPLIGNEVNPAEVTVVSSQGVHLEISLVEDDSHIQQVRLVRESAVAFVGGLLGAIAGLALASKLLLLCAEKTHRTCGGTEASSRGCFGKWMSTEMDASKKDASLLEEPKLRHSPHQRPSDDGPMELVMFNENDRFDAVSPSHVPPPRRVTTQGRRAAADAGTPSIVPGEAPRGRLNIPDLGEDGGMYMAMGDNGMDLPEAELISTDGRLHAGLEEYEGLEGRTT